MRNWIGVEIDGVLAKYTDDEQIGVPIKNMIDNVKHTIHTGYIDVKILTRRTSPEEREIHGEDYILSQIQYIQDFCKKNIGVILPITSHIDKSCTVIWDAKVNQVILNRGVFLQDALDKWSGK